MTKPHVVVIGAGVTGLSAAVTLQGEARRMGAGLRLTVIEREPLAGGHARTIESDGFVVEAGPNGFLSREPESLALVEELGIGARLITANPAAARRFILRGGRLCKVPDSPLSLITTPALSWSGKARLLGEPWAAGPPDVDETVFDFAQRRIGTEAAEVLVDTAVSGISAGDSRMLSVRAQFPMMVDMEREHGSLIRAMLARRRPATGPTRLLSFDRGVGVLTSAMTKALGDSVLTGRSASSIERSGRTWRVGLDDGTAIEADCVLLATPARVSARLVSRVAPRLTEAMTQVPYAGLAVVALGYRATDVPRPLDGYGYLVTRAEGLATLGVVWESSLFAGRAPDGHVLLRAMLGGSRTPSLARLPEAECRGLARAELGQVLGIRTEPVHMSVFQWPEAIAQYHIGHDTRLGSIRDQLRSYPGLHVCGTSYDGVSFNHAIKSGRSTARSIAAALWQERRDTRRAGDEVPTSSLPSTKAG